MTCLYCKKKLGFFSRYKDTPFCSEGHLRAHQEELERAFLERLGPKQKPPQDPIPNIAPELQPIPVRAMLDLDSAVRAQSPNLSVSERLQEDTPPFCNDFVIESPRPVSALDLSLLVVPPSSDITYFPGDCYTPSGASIALEFKLAGLYDRILDHSSFSCRPRSFSIKQQVDTDQVFQTLFLKPDIKFLSQENNKPYNLIMGETQPLDFKRSVRPKLAGIQGLRNESLASPDLQYPDSGNALNPDAKGLPFAGAVFGGVENSRPAEMLASLFQGLEPRQAQVPSQAMPPRIEAQVVLSPVRGFRMAPAATESTRTSMMARTLPFAIIAGRGIPLNSWQFHPAFPVASSLVNSASHWQKAPRRADDVASMPYPSPFHLGPALPPRPESIAL